MPQMTQTKQQSDAPAPPSTMRPRLADTVVANDKVIIPLVELVLRADADNPELSRRLRRSAIIALRGLAPNDDMVVGTLLAASRDPEPLIVREAVAALGDSSAHAPRVIEALEPCLSHHWTPVRDAARMSLGRLGRRAA